LDTRNTPSLRSIQVAGKLGNSYAFKVAQHFVSAILQWLEHKLPAVRQGRKQSEVNGSVPLSGTAFLSCSNLQHVVAILSKASHVASFSHISVLVTVAINYGNEI
jgi:hypothetical protein